MNRPKKLYENLQFELSNFIKDIYNDIISNFGKPKKFGMSWDDWNFAPLGVGLYWTAEYESSPVNDTGKLKMELIQGNRLDENSKKESIRFDGKNIITSGCEYWLNGIYPADLIHEFNMLKEKYVSMDNFFPSEKEIKNDGYNAEYEANYWITFFIRKATLDVNSALLNESIFSDVNFEMRPHDNDLISINSFMEEYLEEIQELREDQNYNPDKNFIKDFCSILADDAAVIDHIIGLYDNI